ncbi:MAG: carbohydrate ABC transporter permease [Nakamurella sp.]
MSTALKAPTATRRRRTPPRRGSTPLAERGVGRSIGIALLWIFVALNVLALIWVIMQAFRDTRSILGSPFGLPKSLALTNFSTAWKVSGFAQATVNSVIVAAVSSTITVALAAPAAYYLSRNDSRFTRSVTMYFILGLGIPAQVIVIPLFVMLASINMVDNLVGLNLVYIGVSMPFTVFLLTGFFRSLPAELEEAAALDGASPTATFLRVMLPVAKGGITTAFVLSLIAQWNETLIALTLIQSTDKYTLPLALISFVQQQTYSGADWGGLFAGLCFVILPMLVTYMWLGRKLSEGLTVGMGK